MIPRPGIVVLLLAAVFGLAVNRSLAAAAPASNAPVTVALEYQETPLAMLTLRLPHRTALATNEVRKLPERSGAPPRLGCYTFDRDRIAFAWYHDIRELRLDLNRNGDFTDDPAGVLSATNGPSRRQVFPGARLELTNVLGVHKFLLELSVQANSTDAGLQSFYAGRADLNGRACQVGLVLNPHLARFSASTNQLLLRPWDERLQPVTAPPAGLECVPLPTKLFFAGSGWEVRLPRAGSEPTKRLELEPCQPPLRELRVSGDSVWRTVLEGDSGWTVVLDAPTGTVQVPAIPYRRQRVGVRQGETAAWTEFVARLDVGNAQASLVLGGPLTNSAFVSRSDRNLIIRHVILGREGQAYHLARLDRAHPPEFTVFKGSKRLVTGRFAFG